MNLRDHDDRPVGDQCVHMRGTFDDYEFLLRMRGECAVPRIAYLEGNIFIVAPGHEHQVIKSLIGRLVETYCLVRRVRFRTLGSWTLKGRREDTGAEPDECYILGDQDDVRPHLAIEVVWTSIGIDKLEIYRRLGVREVWIWRRGQIEVHALRGDQYLRVDASEVLVGVDLPVLASFLDRASTYDAIVEYRALLER